MGPLERESRPPAAQRLSAPGHGLMKAGERMPPQGEAGESVATPTEELEEARRPPAAAPASGEAASGAGPRADAARAKPNLHQWPKATAKAPQRTTAGRCGELGWKKVAG